MDRRTPAPGDTPAQALNMMLLPPKAGLCQTCATKHGEAEPHNAQSLYYQMAWAMEHDGEPPTWHDALAHCTPALKKVWLDGLRSMGVDVDAGQISPGGPTPWRDTRRLFVFHSVKAADLYFPRGERGPDVVVTTAPALAGSGLQGLMGLRLSAASLYADVDPRARDFIRAAGAAVQGFRLHERQHLPFVERPPRDAADAAG